jgi:hypothetical protein
MRPRRIASAFSRSIAAWWSPISSASAAGERPPEWSRSGCVGSPPAAGPDGHSHCLLRLYTAQGAGWVSIDWSRPAARSRAHRRRFQPDAMLAGRKIARCDVMS